MGAPPLGEGEELLGEFFCPRYGLFRKGELFLCFGSICLHVYLSEGDVAEDHGKNVVEVMGYAPREHAQGFEFADLGLLPFDAGAICYVRYGDDLGCVVDGCGLSEDIDHGPVLSSQCRFHVPFTAQNIRRPEAFVLLLEKEPRPFPVESLRRIARHTAHGVVHPFKDTSAYAADPDGRCRQNGPERPFRFSGFPETLFLLLRRRMLLFLDHRHILLALCCRGYRQTFFALSFSVSVPPFSQGSRIQIHQ